MTTKPAPQIIIPYEPPSPDLIKGYAHEVSQSIGQDFESMTELRNFIERLASAKTKHLNRQTPALSDENQSQYNCA